MADFTAAFNLVTKKCGILDATYPPSIGPQLPTGRKAILSVTMPDGIVRQYGSVSSPFLDDGNAFYNEFDLQVDLAGNVYEGLYTFNYTFIESGGGQSTIQKKHSFKNNIKTISTSNAIDPFVPSFTITDETDYSVSGYTETVVRRWSSLFSIVEISHTSSDDSFNMSYLGRYYSGIYDLSLQSDLSLIDGWFRIFASYFYTEEIIIKQPMELSALIALIKALKTKRDSFLVCSDAQYNNIQADFERLMSLFNLFISSGQAALTDDLDEYIDEIVKILQRWGITGVDAVVAAAISQYDFFPNDPNAPVGSGDTRLVYSAGNGCMVSGTALGITFAKNSGVGTFTVASGRLMGSSVSGTAGDATYNSNGATNSFKLVVPVGSANANIGYATLLASLVQIFETANQGSVTDATPLVKDAGAVQTRIVAIGSNTISLVFTGIGSTYSGGWAISFITP